jgi:hypothetical protein
VWVFPARAGLKRLSGSGPITETRKHDENRERKNQNTYLKKAVVENEQFEVEEVLIRDNRKPESLQQVYEREYGRRESFLWKQR